MFSKQNMTFSHLKLKIKFVFAETVIRQYYMTSLEYGTASSLNVRIRIYFKCENPDPDPF